MSPLAVNFSFALLSITTFISLIVLIFRGETNDSFAKYAVSILGSSAALFVFGLTMSNIVIMIKVL